MMKDWVSSTLGLKNMHTFKALSKFHCKKMKLHVPGSCKNRMTSVILYYGYYFKIINAYENVYL